MSRIVPGRKYTYEELAALRDDPELAERSLQGYVLRQDLDGTLEFVKWSQATAGGGSFGESEQPLRDFTSQDDDPFDEASLLPIRRRTPLERVDSLMLRFIDDCRATGTVPGLDDDKVSQIVGTAWVTGRSEVTAEVVREVARYFLQDAEAKA